MDIREGSRLDNLIDSIGDAERQEAERSFEIAQDFPDSVENYMQLPDEERMRVAGNMVRTYYPFFSFERFDAYASYPPADKHVAARVPTDKPGVILNGAVAYYNGNGGGYDIKPDSPGLFVWVQAQNIINDQKSSFQLLGVMELKHSKVTGRSHRVNDGFSLEDPRSQELIEIVDAASRILIENEVQSALAARIGQTALRTP